MLATVKFQIGTQEGIVNVNVEPGDEDEAVIAKAKRLATQRYPSTIGIASETWTITGRCETD